MKPAANERTRFLREQCLKGWSQGRKPMQILNSMNACNGPNDQITYTVNYFKLKDLSI